MPRTAKNEVGYIMPDRTRVRVEAVGVSPGLVNYSGKLGAQKKTAPASVEAQNGSLTEPLGGSAMTEDTNVTRLRRQLIAVEYLELAAQKLLDAKRARVRAIIAARSYGLSSQTIGDALGVTEGAVRGLLRRQGELDQSSGGA